MEKDKETNTDTNTKANTNSNCVLNHKQIIERIPHRYPFLLVDRILKLTKNESIIGLKNVTINEPFFIGHFPKEPVMPGVLIIEALAQAAAVLVCESLNSVDSNNSSAEGGSSEKIVFFSSIDHVKFRRPVVPGDQLILESTILKSKLGFWKCKGVAKVEGSVAVEAEFSAKIM